VDGDASPPVFLTLADKVKAAPTTGLSALTVGDSTTRSGDAGYGTLTVTDEEQLFIVSDSPVTASTQAP
jgi:hypothetical protein